VAVAAAAPRRERLLALQQAMGNRAARDLLQRQDDDDLPPLLEEPGPVPIFDITGRSMRAITAWLERPRTTLAEEVEFDRLRKEEDEATAEYFRLKARREKIQIEETAADRSLIEDEYRQLQSVALTALATRTAIEPFVSRVGTAVAGRRLPATAVEDAKKKRDLLVGEAGDFDERMKVLTLDVQAALTSGTAILGATALLPLLERVRTMRVRAVSLHRLIDTWLDTVRLQLAGTGTATAVPAAPQPVFTATQTPTAIALQLPIAIGNARSVASDIINHPTSGGTGFTVRSSTVYHSSAGSSLAGSQAGTAFWIVQGGNRVLVAMGRHTGGTSDTYRITWRATGVSGYLVKLNSTKAGEALTG
jgi:hypothetical protein